MEINRQNMDVLFKAYNASFREGFGGAPDDWMRVAMRVPSATAENVYGWLGQVPSLEEWLGERTVQSMRDYGYTLRNKSYANAIEVRRPEIEDDQYGVYAPLFGELGRASAAFPNELVFAAIKDNGLCFDGQNFFDTDHPGDAGNVANSDGGAGTKWYLLDMSRMLKPVIYQERKAPMLTRRDDPDDPNVFDKNAFLYGVDCRGAAGYGLWQLAYRGGNTLNKANFFSAFEAMEQFTSPDTGRPLGIKPTHLVVPPSLRLESLELLKAERDAAGATNVARDLTELVVTPWLA